MMSTRLQALSANVASIGIMLSENSPPRKLFSATPTPDRSAELRAALPPLNPKNGTIAAGMEGYLFALTLTTLAGLATGIGSAIAFFARRTNKSALSATLGFSAGVLIYISLADLLIKSQHSLTASFGPRRGPALAAISFFAAIVASALIDRIVPEEENPHEARAVERMEAPAPARGRLLRIGLVSAGALALHNLPEGLAVFMAALQDPDVGVAIAAAVALHNIPEGMSILVPIYYATGSRAKAFLFASLTGLLEPLGAVVGYFLLSRFLGPALFGVMSGLAAGIMVYLAFDELLPAAHEYGEHHMALYGLVAGMATIWGALLLLGHHH